MTASTPASATPAGMGAAQAIWGNRLLLALRAERRRATSTWALWILGAVAVVLPAGYTALVVSEIGRAGAPNVTTQFGVAQALSGGNSAVLMASLLGVLLVTSEWRHSTVAASLTVEPDRLRWLGAKVLVAAVVGLVFGFAAQAGVLAVGLPLLAAKGAALTAARSHIVASSVGTVAAAGFAAVWGVGIGALVKNQVAAVVGTIVYTVVIESLLLNAVPWFGRFLPGGATAALAADPTVAHHLAAGWGAVLWVLWCAVFVAAAAVLTTRSDVPTP